MKLILNKYSVYIFFILLFSFICLNITNTPGFYDSAEFAISYIDNSITHPPSYPFTYIFNKAFASILPFKTMWKLHFINSLYSFLALVFFYLYLSFFTKDKILKIIFVLQLFFADFFLNYTFNLEVYSLFFLFTMMFFYFYQKTMYDNGYFNLLLYIFSVGIIVHPLILFLFPFLIDAFLKVKKIQLLHMVLIVLPLFSYGVLMGLSRHIPLFNWENPQNLKGLLHIILRRGYSQNTLEFDLKGLHLSATNIFLNMSIIFFILPVFFMKKFKFPLLYSLLYLIVISTIFQISPNIFDWSAFFFPVYIIFYGITLQIVEKKWQKLRYILFIIPLILMITHFDYLPFGKYPYPDAYFNDINKKMSGKKNVVFVNGDSLLFISYLKMLQKKSKYIPIVPTFINYNWYINSMKKYTELKFPDVTKEKYNLYQFFNQLRVLNPEYKFYNTGIVDNSLKKLGNIPPTLLVKLNDNSFNVIDYNKMDFMELPQKNIFEYKFYLSQYEIYIKNLILYYLYTDIGKSLHYFHMLKNKDYDYFYLKKLIYEKF